MEIAVWRKKKLHEDCPVVFQFHVGEKKKPVYGFGTT